MDHSSQKQLFKLPWKSDKIYQSFNTTLPTARRHNVRPRKCFLPFDAASFRHDSGRLGESAGEPSHLTELAKRYNFSGSVFGQMIGVSNRWKKKKFWFAILKRAPTTKMAVTIAPCAPSCPHCSKSSKQGEGFHPRISNEIRECSNYKERCRARGRLPWFWYLVLLTADNSEMCSCSAPSSACPQQHVICINLFSSFTFISSVPQQLEWVTLNFYI